MTSREAAGKLARAKTRPKKGVVAGMHLHKGALHRAMGVPEGQPIPAAKMAEARNSQNPHVRRMAATARELEGFHHGG